MGNPGPGGWAWAVPGGRFAAGAEAKSTNQRMEVQAAWEALKAIDGPLHIVSDSTYVVKCFNDKWYEGWTRRGWKNASKQPVANQDLWRPFIDLYLTRAYEVTFAWVKGHSGDPMNDVVDRLAVEASRTQQPRAGEQPPDRLGDPDVAAPVPVSRVRTTGDRSGSIPSGWKVAVFGHRPPELGGYDIENPVATDIRRRLTEVLRGWASVHPDLVVYTGMGLGAEQLAADVCAEEGLPFVAVLPYPEPDRVWPDSTRRRYRALLNAARSVITRNPDAPTTRQEAGRAAGDRDRWVVGSVDAAVVVWDGADRGLGELVKALEGREVDVFPLTPQVQA